jgi:hypothetical protein
VGEGKLGGAPAFRLISCAPRPLLLRAHVRRGPGGLTVATHVSVGAIRARWLARARYVQRVALAVPEHRHERLLLRLYVARLAGLLPGLQLGVQDLRPLPHRAGLPLLRGLARTCRAFRLCRLQ